MIQIYNRFAHMLHQTPHYFNYEMTNYLIVAQLTTRLMHQR